MAISHQAAGIRVIQTTNDKSEDMVAVCNPLTGEQYQVNLAEVAGIGFDQNGWGFLKNRKRDAECWLKNKLQAKVFSSEKGIYVKRGEEVLWQTDLWKHGSWCYPSLQVGAASWRLAVRILALPILGMQMFWGMASIQDYR